MSPTLKRSGPFTLEGSGDARFVALACRNRFDTKDILRNRVDTSSRTSSATTSSPTSLSPTSFTKGSTPVSLRTHTNSSSTGVGSDAIVSRVRKDRPISRANPSQGRTDQRESDDWRTLALTRRYDTTTTVAKTDTIRS
jgi:hypothetical protein